MVTTVAGWNDYRDQLGRARRFRDRMFASNADATEFQDMAWAFFQNCWPVKDWVKNDQRIAGATRAAVTHAAEDPATPLKLCHELCNGTKHLMPRGATQGHAGYTLFLNSDRSNEIDFMVDDGKGNRVSARQLADDCLAEWERILASQGLAAARPS
jgi:hypothetical protein